MSLFAKIPRGCRAAISARARITLGYLNQICSGHRRPNLGTAIEIAAALRDLVGLDMSLEELLGVEIPLELRLRADDPVPSPGELAERRACRALLAAERELAGLDAGAPPPEAPEQTISPPLTETG